MRRKDHVSTMHNRLTQITHALSRRVSRAALRCCASAICHESFNSVLLAREDLAVAEESVLRADENLKEVTSRFKQGFARKFDLLRAEEQVSRALDKKWHGTMKMTRFEKLFVNRERKGRRNAEVARRLLTTVGALGMGDVLEIGCGTGPASAVLARERGARAMATDVDPDEVLLASRMSEGNERLSFEVQDATALTFTVGSFDLVIAQMVFHHIPNWSQAASEIARVLRLHGLFIWQDLVFPEWLRRVVSSVGTKYGIYTLHDVRSEFSACGFVPKFHEERRHGPFVHHYMVLQKGESQACPTLLGRSAYR